MLSLMELNKGVLMHIGESISIYFIIGIPQVHGKWVKWMHLREYYYNITHHMSNSVPPFQVLYGYDTLSFINLLFLDGRVPAANDLNQS